MASKIVLYKSYTNAISDPETMSMSLYYEIASLQRTMQMTPDGKGSIEVVYGRDGGVNVCPGYMSRSIRDISAVCGYECMWTGRFFTTSRELSRTSIIYTNTSGGTDIAYGFTEFSVRNVFNIVQRMMQYDVYSGNFMLFTRSTHPYVYYTERAYDISDGEPEKPKFADFSRSLGSRTGLVLVVNKESETAFVCFQDDLRVDVDLSDQDKEIVQEVLMRFDMYRFTSGTLAEAEIEWKSGAYPTLYASILDMLTSKPRRFAVF